MTPENTQMLHNLFPSLFKEEFYFECSDGWYNIIFDLAKQITSVTNLCSAAQVKEKFHSLRFYIAWADGEDGLPFLDEDTISKIWSLIEVAENKSFSVCEICGVTKSKKEKYCFDCSKKLYK
jgi:hypothetical protein